LDLNIHPGKVQAMVMGSASLPYQVTITIKPIPKIQWQHIKDQCKGEMDSIKQLMTGKFPKALKELFTRKGKGLFPSPEDIDLDCSCPDRAVMCKHVAAVLYGIGARLDQDPSLFFVLRKANINDLISETVKETRKDLLTRSKKQSSRKISDTENLSDMFGIDLDPDGLTDSEPARPEPPARAPRKSAKPDGQQKQTRAAESRPKTAASQTPSRRIKDADGIETLFKRRTKRHTSVAEVIEKSDMDPQKVRNILFRLMHQGKLERVSRGIYRWVRSK
jgi:uncharacterized Zn finger protein